MFVRHGESHLAETSVLLRQRQRHRVSTYTGRSCSGTFPERQRAWSKQVVTGMNDKSDAPQGRAFAIRCYAWSRAIHWVTVALVSGLLITALFYNIDAHGPGNRAFFWHSSLGITLYLLTITRVLLWFVYRPTASVAGKPDAGVHRGLRAAFYALLVALPVSGWWLASAQSTPSQVLWVPTLPQWLFQQDATHSVAADPETSRQDGSQNAAVVRALSRLHASLAAALAIVVVLHLLPVIKSRMRDRGSRPGAT
jgi:cytochrome b561